MLRDQNLLFGMLAVQLKLATPQQLVNAGALWTAQQERPLGDILVEQGALAAGDRALIDALITRQVQAAGGDAQQVYELYGGDSAAQSSFGGSLVFGKQSRAHSFAPLGGSVDEQPTPAAARSDGQHMDETGGLVTEQPGRYTVRGEQGRGGIGRVLLAFDESIRREIALKELLPSGTLSGGGSDGSPQRRSRAQVTRFLREARITGQLEHPGIVPVYELGQREDGTVYYTMKLLRGVTLAARLKECRSLADRLGLLNHFVDLCHAIAYAHSRHVIHRDIKPANVMVGEFGETVLLDWGLAKVQGQQDEGAEKLADEVRQLKEAGAEASIDGKPIGTPSYMPPEQADGRIADVDERSDVWSLGAVLYELLTGRPPFTGVTAFEVIGAVLADDVTPVLEVNKDAPPELAAVAQRCLQRDPANRYQHVEELAADITAFQTGGLVGAYKYSSARMFSRWVRRRWPVLATAGVALLLMLGLAAVAYARVVRERNAALAANLRLDKSQLDLLAFKLTTHSREQLAANRSELATLLALEAAERCWQPGQWRPSVDYALRVSTGGEQFYCRDLPGHQEGVRRVAFSPDGKWLVSCSSDATLRLWDLRTPGTPSRTLNVPEGYVSMADFSPDSRWLAAACSDRLVRLWDLAAPAAEPQVLEGHTDAIWCVDISPDGRWIASGGVDQTVRVWDMRALETAPRIFAGSTQAVQGVAFSPDSRRLAAGGDDGVLRIWVLAQPEAAPVTHSHPDPIMALAYSPDGQMVTTTCADRLVRLWPTAGGAPRILQGHAEGVVGLCYSPDGSRLATCSSDATLRIWSLRNAAVLPLVLHEPDGIVWSVAFSNDGKQLASAGETGIVHVWQIPPPAPPAVIRSHDRQVLSAVFSPDGRFIATGGGNHEIHLTDLTAPGAAPRIMRGHTDLVRVLASSPDGRQLASGSGDRTIRLWDLDRPAAPAQVLLGHADRVAALAYSPDGRTLASASWDRTVRVWDPAAPQTPPRLIGRLKDNARAVAFTPDGSALAAGGDEGLIHIWPLAGTGPERVIDARTELVRALTFSPDGKLLVTSGMDSFVRVWDLSSTPPKATLLQANDSAGSVAFSPDGALLAVASDDRNVRLWDLAHLSAEPQVLVGHTDDVTSVTFNRDGNLLASTSVDKTVRLWEVRTEDLLARARALPRRNMTMKEWEAFMGLETPYRRTLPKLPAGVGAPGGPLAEVPR